MKFKFFCVMESTKQKEKKDVLMGWIMRRNWSIGGCSCWSFWCVYKYVHMCGNLILNLIQSSFEERGVFNMLNQ